MKQEVCKLCNRKFKHSYDLFGRNCLNSEYKLLGIERPKGIKNKELYLCNHIARQLHMTKLNRNEKYILTEKYLTIQYLDKIKYGNLNKEKEELWKEINDKIFEKASSIISLSKAYRLYKTVTKFSDRIKEIEKSSNEKNENQINEEKFLESMQFIFDMKKISNPIEYQVYYYMQYTFWEIVVVGGYFKNMKLSAILMQNSLSLFGENPRNISITDKNTIIDIKNNDAFKEKVKAIINKYGKGKKSFVVNEQNNDDPKDINVEFNNNYDLFLAIHGAQMNIEANKIKEGIWDLDITINDTYDFTDWKNKEDTYDESVEPKTDAERIKILANILNNFGVISMKYGVLKPFKIGVEIKINSDEL